MLDELILKAKKETNEKKNHIDSLYKEEWGKLEEFLSKLQANMTEIKSKNDKPILPDDCFDSYNLKLGTIGGAHMANSAEVEFYTKNEKYSIQIAASMRNEGDKVVKVYGYKIADRKLYDKYFPVLEKLTKKCKCRWDIKSGTNTLYIQSERIYSKGESTVSLINNIIGVQRASIACNTYLKHKDDKAGREADALLNNIWSDNNF